MLKILSMYFYRFVLMCILISFLCKVRRKEAEIRRRFVLSNALNCVKLLQVLLNVLSHVFLDINFMLWASVSYVLRYSFDVIGCVLSVCRDDVQRAWMFGRLLAANSTLQVCFIIMCIAYYELSVSFPCFIVSPTNQS